MAIEFNGKQFDVAQSVLDAAMAFVSSIMPNAKTSERNEQVEKMLGKGIALARKDEKAKAIAEHEEKAKEYEYMAQDIMAQPEYQQYHDAFIMAYGNLNERLVELRHDLGFVPEPRKMDPGYVAQVPASLFDAMALSNKTNEWRAKCTLDDKQVPWVHLTFDLPNLTVEYENMRKYRDELRNWAMTFAKDLGNVHILVNRDGKIVLTDPDARVPSSTASGTPRAAAAPKSKIWAVAGSDTPIVGRKFEGTNREVFDQMRGLGVKFSPSAVPASIQNGQVSKKLVSSWGWLS